jgi:hypothetical protein
MPKNLDTNLEEFVEKNPKNKPNKSQIKSDVLECIKNSDRKMSVFEISKSTGYKADNVYIAIIETKEFKSKNIKGTAYWYFDENQIDPIIISKVIEKKKTDPLFLEIYERDKKNSPNNRRIFLSSDERQEYNKNKRR